jgi:hypothetical protein
LQTDTEALKPYTTSKIHNYLHISESVSDDYLQYMLLQFPTNVTGWICHTLVTSSLLKVSNNLSVKMFAEVIYVVLVNKNDELINSVKYNLQ